MKIHLVLLVIIFLLSLIVGTHAKKHSRRRPHPKPHPKPHKHPKTKKGNSNLYKDQSGTATWFSQDSEGSCGHWSKDSDMIVALPESINGQKYCGQTVIIKYKNKTIKTIVADTCPSCDSKHLDLSKGAFSALTKGNMDLGLINVHWHIQG